MQVTLCKPSRHKTEREGFAVFYGEAVCFGSLSSFFHKTRFLS